MRVLVRAWLALIIITMLCAATGLGAEQKGESSQLKNVIGHVFNSETQPLQKAIVYLKNTKTLMIKSYITDPDGSFRFSALAPNVDYELYAQYQGTQSDTKTLSAFDNRKQFDVTLRIRNK